MENALEQDDSAIHNHRILWRRVPSEYIFFDPNLNRYRPRSQAFQNTSGTNGMSVNLADETTVDSTLKDRGNDFLVAFPAGLARELEQEVIRKPLDNNPAHCEVTGNKTGKVRNAFAKRCKWVVGPKTES
jgi:hypothetical protein